MARGVLLLAALLVVATGALWPPTLVSVMPRPGTIHFARPSAMRVKAATQYFKLDVDDFASADAPCWHDPSDWWHSPSTGLPEDPEHEPVSDAADIIACFLGKCIEAPNYEATALAQATVAPMSKDPRPGTSATSPRDAGAPTGPASRAMEATGGTTATSNCELLTGGGAAAMAKAQLLTACDATRHEHAVGTCHGAKGDDATASPTSASAGPPLAPGQRATSQRVRWADLESDDSDYDFNKGAGERTSLMVPVTVAEKDVTLTPLARRPDDAVVTARTSVGSKRRARRRKTALQTPPDGDASLGKAALLVRTLDAPPPSAVLASRPLEPTLEASVATCLNDLERLAKVDLLRAPITLPLKAYNCDSIALNDSQKLCIQFLITLRDIHIALTGNCLLVCRVAEAAIDSAIGAGLTLEATQLAAQDIMAIAQPHLLKRTPVG